jgi:hypothetical protein
MKNIRKCLSVFLAFSMIAGMLSQSAVAVHAADAGSLQEAAEEANSGIAESKTFVEIRLFPIRMLAFQKHRTKQRARRTPSHRIQRGQVPISMIQKAAQPQKKLRGMTAQLSLERKCQRSTNPAILRIS